MLQFCFEEFIFSDHCFLLYFVPCVCAGVFFDLRNETIICCSWRWSYWYWMIQNYHKTHAAMTDVSMYHHLLRRSYFFFLPPPTKIFSEHQNQFSLYRIGIWKSLRRNLNVAFIVCRSVCVCIDVRCVKYDEVQMV